MKFTIVNAQQGTGEWFAARLGRVTGSKAGDAIAMTRNGESQKRIDYKAQLLAERLTGQVADNFVSKDMQWGTEQEPFARMAYESQTGLLVRETGFLSARDIAVGASLDGDVNEFEGIIEIKCPKTSTHIKWMLDAKLPDDHMPQVVHNMWVSGAAWCDFISYDPRLPEPLQLFVHRVHRDENAISEHRVKISNFLQELDALQERLTRNAA